MRGTNANSQFLNKKLQFSPTFNMTAKT